MIGDFDPGDGAFCPRCGAQVLETDYACAQCTQLLPWKWEKKPDEEELPGGDKK